MADQPRSPNSSGYPGSLNDLQPFEEVHVVDYLKVLHKRRWTALSAFLVVLVAVTVYTFTATPKFEAVVRVLIRPDSANVVEFQPVVEELAEADYYQTQYELLQSRTLARKTLQDGDLWDEYRSKSEEDPAILSVVSATVAGLFASSAGESVEPDDEGDALVDAKPIDRILDSLDVSPVRNSRLVDIRVRSADRRLAARTANAHARAYVDQNLELRLLASQEASGWLKEQLEEQRRKVEESEWALQRYLEQNGTVTFENRENIVIQRLGDLNSAVTDARTKRIGIETRYNRLRAVRDDPDALYSFPAIISNQYIQEQRLELSRLEREYVELSEDLGERHPDILRVRSAIENVTTRIDEEIQNVADSIEDEFLAARTEENSLEAVLEAQKVEALSSNEKGIQYAVLQRDVESDRQVYDALLQRVKETDVSGELQTNNILIVDSAEVPRSPATPRKALNLLLALLGGGLLGVGLAFFFEYADTRVKTPDEVKVHLGLPAVGVVPVIPAKALKGLGTPLVNNGVPPIFRESFNGLRTNLVFSADSDDEGKGRQLLVTSTGAGEGKTLTASNLAISLADVGQRVLLLDADLRLPRVHEVFEQALEPGVSNLTAGQATAEKAIRKTNVPGLWILPAGTISSNPSELLASKRFKSFLEALKSHFDWVLVDSPPVLAVTDASIIAPWMERVLFVVGAEMTHRDAAQAAVERLEAVHAQFAGVVLNRVPLERNSYYYSRYYRQEYSSYYTRPHAAS